MIRSVYFEPLGSGSALNFIWDDVAGTLTGQSAELMFDLIEQAKKTGCVTGDPWPTSYPIKNPLHSLAEMAAIVSSWHVRLPDEWSEALQSIAPYPEDPIEDPDILY